MATPTTVQRTAEVGDDFRTFTTAGVHTQGVSIVDEAGAHQGVTGNALVVDPGTVTIDDSTPIDVNVASQTAAFAIDDSTPIDVNIASGIANPLPVSLAAETFVRYSTPAAGEDTKLDIGTGACELRQLRVILDPTVTSVRYLMFFNQTGAISPGTDPDWRMVVPIAGEASETFAKGEMAFSTGLSIALSSTYDDLTVTTASEGFFQVVVAV